MSKFEEKVKKLSSLPLLQRANIFLSTTAYILAILLIVPIQKSFPGQPILVWLVPAIFIGFSLVAWVWTECWMPFCLKYWENLGVLDFLTKNKEQAQSIFRVVLLFVNFILILAISIWFYSYFMEGHL